MRSREEIKQLKKQKPPLCKCGCGESVKWAFNCNHWNTYLHNHHNRKKGYHQKIKRRPSIPPLCKCGCGQPTKLHDSNKQYNTYIAGHAQRNKTYHQRHKAKQPTCKCGCKQKTKWCGGKWNEYINHHHGPNRLKTKILKNKKPPYCKCGCAKTVKWNRNKGQWCKYLVGHNFRVMEGHRSQTQLLNLKKQQPLCACGCGKPVNWHNKKYKWAKYFKNHYQKITHYKGGVKAAKKRYQEKAVTKLFDSYVKNSLKIKIKRSEIPIGMIEAQRVKLKIHRAIKKRKKGA